MEQLWAPWRMAYVEVGLPRTEADSCFICRSVAEDRDRENLVLCRSPRTMVMLNRFPYNNGHLLVSPREHKGRLEDLESAELLELMEGVRGMVQLIGRCMKPDGYNIGLNLGRAAGAGLPGHLHWHIVPRWNGDTNFMSTVTDVRVIVQSLEALFDLLQDGLSATETTGLPR